MMVRLAEHPGGPDNSMKGFIEAGRRRRASTHRPRRPRRPRARTAEPSGRSATSPPRFDGKDRRGTWTLAGARPLRDPDSGMLCSWGITSQKAVCRFRRRRLWPPSLVKPAGRLITEDSSPTFALRLSSMTRGATFECQPRRRPTTKPLLVRTRCMPPCSTASTRSGCGQSTASGYE